MRERRPKLGEETMQRFKLLSTLLVAVLALGVVVTASASAEDPLILPEPTKEKALTFTSEGPAAELLSAAGVIKCTKVKNAGEFTGVREGKVTVTFEGCKSLEANCKTIEAAEGTLVWKNLEIHLVTFKEGVMLNLGAVITLPANIAFTCGKLKAEVKGNVMGRVNGVISGVATEKAILLFHTVKDKQVFKECELPAAFCKARKFLLELSFGLGFEEASLESEDKLTFAQKVEFIF
jgi:hypothetical protein